jgi:hypothetical protein
MQNKSDSIKELATALAKAQSEMNMASLSSTNPFFKSKYADFGEIVKSSRPALTKNGLSVVQPICIEGDYQVLETILLHSSGEWISSKIKINPPKQDVQSLGSYITYLKRYSYASLVGVITGDDDDAEEAMYETRNSNHKPQTYTNEPTISQDQLDELEQELEGYLDIAQQVLFGLKINSLSKMPKSLYSSSMKRIRELKLAKDK